MSALPELPAPKLVADPAYTRSNDVLLQYAGVARGFSVLFMLAQVPAGTYFQALPW